MSETLDARFASQMGAFLGPDFPMEIGLAVSGGGDSMAMLALAHNWARRFGIGLRVVTINHGLRPEAAAEAALVAGECKALGHPHSILDWHWNGEGNLQDAARRGRLDLIDAWRGDLRHVLFAHTQDDVAETLLMRLLRGSGVEGLSSIPARRLVYGNAGPWEILRPLLTIAREELRHYVHTLHVPFADDPSNEDERFDRVKIRRAIAGLGLDAEALAATAERMSRARVALEARAEVAAQAAMREVVWNGRSLGAIEIDRDSFASIELDTQLRLLASALQWVSGSPYRPRARALEMLLEKALAGSGGTLTGARLFVTARTIQVVREAASVNRLEQPFDGAAIWDQRWQLQGPAQPRTRLRALGSEGAEQLGQAGCELPPRQLILPLPALFAGPRLVACPPLGWGQKISAELRPNPSVRLLPVRNALNSGI